MKRDTEKRDAEIVELIHKNSIRLLAELGLKYYGTMPGSCFRKMVFGWKENVLILRRNK